MKRTPMTLRGAEALRVTLEMGHDFVSRHEAVRVVSCVLAAG